MPLIFEDAVGVLVVAEVLPEAADVVLDDAVAGQKPGRQAVEVVEAMLIPLELVDEPPDVLAEREQWLADRLAWLQEGGARGAERWGRARIRHEADVRGSRFRSAIMR